MTSPASPPDLRPGPPPDVRLARVDHDLAALGEDLHDVERLWAAWLDRTHPELCDSARNLVHSRNLVHYGALRRYDLQGLQQDLTAYGMSSLGRSEPHVAATLSAVHALVRVLRGRLGPDAVTPVTDTAVDAGTTTIRNRPRELLGPEP